MINSQLKQSLKTKAHHLQPVILIGAKGLTEAVISETNIALDAHELIKIKIRGHEKEDCKKISEILCSQLDAELIQFIGGTFVIYRKKKG